MVNDPLDWRWSSYSAMTGESSPADWLETDWILAHFGRKKKPAIVNYINFVREGVGLPPVWDALKHQVYLGDDAFVERIRDKVLDADSERLREVSRVQRRPLAKPLQWYAENSPDRKRAIALPMPPVIIL